MAIPLVTGAVSTVVAKEGTNILGSLDNFFGNVFGWGAKCTCGSCASATQTQQFGILLTEYQKLYGHTNMVEGGTWTGQNFKDLWCKGASDYAGWLADCWLRVQRKRMETGLSPFPVEPVGRVMERYNPADTSTRGYRAVVDWYNQNKNSPATAVNSVASLFSGNFSGITTGNILFWVAIIGLVIAVIFLFRR